MAKCAVCKFYNKILIYANNHDVHCDSHYDKLCYECDLDPACLVVLLVFLLDFSLTSSVETRPSSFFASLMATLYDRNQNAHINGSTFLPSLNAQQQDFAAVVHKTM